MKLDEFITDALIQIANGVAVANRILTRTDEPKGAIPFIMQRGNDGGQTAGIAFDVAVTTRLSAQANSEGKTSIWVVDAQINAEAAYDREQISRLRFTVGVDSRLGYGPNTLLQSKCYPE